MMSMMLMMTKEKNTYEVHDVDGVVDDDCYDLVMLMILDMSYCDYYDYCDDDDCYYY